MKFDKWQEEVLKEEGNIVVCSGRQTGKSTIIAVKASESAVAKKKQSIMIISVTEDQSILLLQKCLSYLEDNYKKLICKGVRRPTKQKIELTNGSIIRTKAVGASGLGARGFTLNMLIADEAAFMPEDVWAAVTPGLATTGGQLILISTPHGKKGYFYQQFHSEHFKTWHLNTIDVYKERDWTEQQRQIALNFIESERARMSEREFGQEYLGLFLEELMQFFPDDVIRKAMIQSRQDISKEGRDFYIGIDVARMGGDKTTFEIIEKRGEMLIHRENIVWKRTLLTETAEKILNLDLHYNFRKIYVDDGGLGVSIFDSLLSNPQTKRKVVPINNATRVIEYRWDKEPKRKKLMKEDLYNNLLSLMEKGKILILDDGDIWQSFKSIQYEYLNEKGGAVMRIFGDDSHIIEGLIRAAWCVKDKINKVWIRSF